MTLPVVGRPRVGEDWSRNSPRPWVGTLATAGEALLGSSFRVTQVRGTVLEEEIHGRPERLVPTVHPSVVPRADDREVGYRGLPADPKGAAPALGNAYYRSMPLTFTFDPVVTPELRDGILDLWADVTNAGGAVGFVPPVTRDDIRPGLVRQFVAMAEERSRLLVGHDEEGRVAATAFLTLNTHHLMTHWIWLYTVMVHPRHQGRGYGRDLLAAAGRAARTLDGVEAVRLTCRGGLGLERFYASCGYKEVGRVPGAIRVAPGDDRDDVIMLLPLT